MIKTINENCLICIKKEGRLLKVDYLEFEENELVKNKSYIDLKALRIKENTWEYIRDRGYELVNNLRSHLPKYFHLEEALKAHPSEAYGREFTIGPETLFKKIPQKIAGDETKYFLYYEDDAHRYGLYRVIDKLELTSINYLYKNAVTKAKQQGVLAYSHRKFGWNTEIFDLDESFKIKVDTNFGYGLSSYFTLTLVFNNIPIIPYPKIVYYQYANASSLLHYTQDYQVEYQNFERCFNFVSQVVNDFIQNGKETFVHKHIIKALEELTLLIDKIMDTNIFYFVDLAKIDNYLELNGRNIIYDYEHLVDNVNPYAINKKALHELLAFYEDCDFDIGNDQNLIKMNSELTKFVLRESAREKTNDKFYEERYGYAIAMLLYKYSVQHNSWRDIDDDTFNVRMHKIVRNILNLEVNYKILLYRKSGIKLLFFRNERIHLALKMIDNISGLSGLIDSNTYINKICNAAKLMLKQNQEYLSEIEPVLTNARLEYLTQLKIFTEVNDKFENTLLSKQFNYYNNLIQFYKNIIVNCKYDLNENTVIFSEKSDEAFEDLILHVINSEKIASIKMNELLSIEGFGNNNMYRPWAIKTLRERYINTGAEQDKQALEMILKIVKQWYEFITFFEKSSNKEYLKTKLIEILTEIAIMSRDLVKLIPNDIEYITSFKEFSQSFYENHKHYLSIKPQYDEVVEPVNELRNMVKNLEQKYETIERNKERIIEYNKILEEEIND